MYEMVGSTADPLTEFAAARMHWDVVGGEDKEDVIETFVPLVC